MEKGLIRLTGTDKIMKEANQAKTLKRARENEMRMQRLEEEIKEFMETRVFKSLWGKFGKIPVREIKSFLAGLDKATWESLALQKARSKIKLFWICSSPAFALMLFLQAVAISVFFTEGMTEGLAVNFLALAVNVMIGGIVAVVRQDNRGLLLFSKIRKLKKLGGREIIQTLEKEELKEVEGKLLIREREIKEFEAEKKKEKSLRLQEKVEDRKARLAEAQMKSLWHHLRRISNGGLESCRMNEMIIEDRENVFKMTKENATKRCRIYGGALGLGACGLAVGVSLLGPIFAFASFALAPLFFGFLNNHWFIKKGCFWGDWLKASPNEN